MKHLKRTKRVKIDIGFKCNLQCRFCYYQEHLTDPNPPSEVIKWRLRFAKKNGIRDIDFSGGEPTIRSDFPDLLSYAKNLGFRNRCVITNGLKLSNMEYAKRLVEAGLNEVLFSIHGPNAIVHDYLTQVRGSFDKLLQAIQNIKDLNIKFRTNSTICKSNYKYLPNLAILLRKLNPKAVNFISFNDWSQACNVAETMICRYSEVASYFKEAINILSPQIGKISVRYFPFCFMQGYEKYVCNFLQKRYDEDEWVERVKIRIEGYNFIRYWLKVFKCIILYHPLDRVETFNFRYLIEEALVEQMRRANLKSEKCKNCKYYKLCDGIEKSYAEYIGLDEIDPVEGEIIKDPLYFMKSI